MCGGKNIMNTFNKDLSVLISATYDMQHLA